MVAYSACTVVLLDRTEVYTFRHLHSNMFAKHIPRHDALLYVYVEIRLYLHPYWVSPISLPLGKYSVINR